MKIFACRVGIIVAVLVSATIFSYPFWTINFSRDHREVIRQKAQEALRRCPSDQQLHLIINGVDLYPPAMAVGGFTPVDEQDLEKDVCSSDIHVTGINLQKPIIEYTRDSRRAKEPKVKSDFRKWWADQKIANGFSLRIVGMPFSYSILGSIALDQDRLLMEQMNVPDGYKVYYYPRENSWLLTQGEKELYAAICVNKDFFKLNNSTNNCRFADVILNGKVHIEYIGTFSTQTSYAHDPVDLFAVYLSTLRYIDSLTVEGNKPH